MAYPSVTTLSRDEAEEQKKGGCAVTNRNKGCKKYVGSLLS